MIITERKRELADAVLAYLKWMNNRDDKIELDLETYSNGREYGYVLKLDTVDGRLLFSNQLWIAFSEFRRSDDIVIYTDKGYWNGQLTDKSYEESKSFRYDEAAKAAEYIKNIIEGYAANIRKELAEKETEKV